MTAVTVALLLGLGSWAALDATAAGQFMISRAFVTATLTGWILGDPLLGAAVGGLLEVLFLGSFPVGGAELPEPGPAAIPATVLATSWSEPDFAASGAALAAGVSLGILLSFVGGKTVVWQRRWNERVTGRAWKRTGGERKALGTALRSTLAADALRGALLTGLGLVVVVGLTTAEGVHGFLVGAWGLDGSQTAAVIGIAGALSLGRLANGSSAAKGRRVVQRPILLLLVGVGCGVAIAVTVGGLVEVAPFPGAGTP